MISTLKDSPVGAKLIPTSKLKQGMLVEGPFSKDGSAATRLQYSYTGQEPTHIPILKGILTSCTRPATYNWTPIWLNTVDGPKQLEAQNEHYFKLYDDVGDFIAQFRRQKRILAGDRMNITIGSDPEVFVTDAAGVIVPAFTFLPAKPKGLDMMKLDSHVPYWDGFQAEFTTLPTYCHAWVVDYVQKGLFKTLLAAPPGSRLSCKDVMDIPYEMMMSTKPKHTELGCAPSTNIYSDNGLCIAEGRDIPFRFAGFHVHHGYGTLQESQLERVVKAMDRLYGPIGVSMLAGLEDPRRRQFYGRAGEFRTPPHGLEYRVPSAATMCHPILTHLTFDIVRIAGRMGLDQVDDLFWPVDGGEERIRHIINNLDVDEARRVLAENSDNLHRILATLYNPSINEASISKVQNFIIKGALHFGIDPDQMHSNWFIESTGKGWESHWLFHSSQDNGCVAKSISNLLK